MKLNFPRKDDGAFHEYCLVCKAETVVSLLRDGRVSCYCTSCGKTSGRSIIIDPAVNWWLAPDGEYWHETAGIFVRNPAREFLFFERTRFPVGLTVPAGHVDAGEAPLAAGRRELFEETGLRQSQLKLVASDEIPGDSCRRGSDAHRWHSFLITLTRPVQVEVTAEEGIRPVWLTLSQALDQNITFATRFVINRHAALLTA